MPRGIELGLIELGLIELGLSMRHLGCDPSVDPGAAEGFTIRPPLLPLDVETFEALVMPELWRRAAGQA